MAMRNIATKGLECHAVDTSTACHHRGSAAVAGCGAEKHDRGNPSISRQHNLLIDWHTIVDGVKMEVCN